MHGNECCGAFVVHELMRELDPATLAGTVVALPILNITAFQVQAADEPLRGLRRRRPEPCFPGKADGTLTEQMAHAIYTELKAHADYLVDLHTAMTADVRWALFANAPGEVGKKGEGMARAFGFKSTLPAPHGHPRRLGDDGRPRATASRPHRRGGRKGTGVHRGARVGRRASACAT